MEDKARGSLAQIQAGLHNDFQACGGVTQLRMVAQAYSPGSQDMEAGGSTIQGQPQLHESQGYLKAKQQITNK